MALGKLIEDVKQRAIECAVWHDTDKPERNAKLQAELDAACAALRTHIENWRLLLGSSQAAAQSCLSWLESNKDRLHRADCSYHEPSARCSCGLHSVRSYVRAIENGTVPLFFEPREPVDGIAGLRGNAGVLGRDDQSLSRDTPMKE